MAQAKLGDRVAITYIGKLDDGTIFDKSTDSHGFSFKLGGGEMIPELEKHVIGMKKGDTCKFVISPEKAFGTYHKELVIEIDRKALPLGKEWKVGDGLQVDVDGDKVPAKIVKLESDKVMIDANHPLAGKSLHFEIKLENIES